MKKRLALLFLALPLAAYGHDEGELQQRLEELELRVKHLEQHLLASEAQPQLQPKEAEFGYAEVNYWLGKSSAFDGKAGAALRSGRMKLGEDILLRPSEYGDSESSASVFSKSTDPSLFPVVSLSVEGLLRIPEAAEYTFTLKPTPPREVGGSGNVQLAVRVYLADRLVFSQPYSSTLAPSSKAVALAAGDTPLRMEIVAKSPGFGPSPTRGRVFVGLQGPEAVKPEPISKFLLPLQ